MTALIVVCFSGDANIVYDYNFVNLQPSKSYIGVNEVVALALELFLKPDCRGSVTC